MSPERLALIKDTLNRRQPDLTVVMENVCKPHNLAAVARTLEAVGGIDIHAITRMTSLRLSQMSAAGIRKWMHVNKHQSTEQGIAHLRGNGYRIIATTLNETSKDYRDIDYTAPTAILVGEELEGITEQAIEQADECVTIPIVGMVQSLNVSVATSLVLYEAYRQRESAGMYEQRRLDEKTYTKLLFEACHPIIANFCREKRLPYPAIDDEAELLEPVAGSLTANGEDFASWMKKTER